MDIPEQLRFSKPPSKGLRFSGSTIPLPRNPKSAHLSGEQEPHFLDYDLDNNLYKGRPCYYGRNMWTRDELVSEAIKWGIVTEGLSEVEICSSLRAMKELEVAPNREVANIYIPYDRSNFEKFRGNELWEWGWLLYLYSSLPVGTMCLIDIQTESNNPSAFVYSENNEYRENGVPELIIEDWVDEVLFECKKEYRFSVAILNISPERGPNHANAIIFDNEENTVARFEPHGDALGFYNADILDDLFSRYVATLDTNMGEWEYISLSRECGPGPQYLQTQTQESYINKMKAIFGDRTDFEAEGFCSVWTLMFIHLRMLNPDAYDEEIVEYMQSHNGMVLNDMVRRYAAYIVNVVDENWPLVHKLSMMNIGDFVVFKYRGTEYEGVIYEIDKDKFVATIVLPERVEGIRGRFIPVPVRMIGMNDKGDYEEIREKIKGFATERVLRTLGWA